MAEVGEKFQTLDTAMLSATRIIDKEKVYAWLEEKNKKPFSCPECEDEVILRKGVVKIHHFAHKPPFSCSYGQGESEEHRRCKYEIYNRLLKEDSVTGCEIEKNLNTIRPDIFCYVRNTPVAIEVQLSVLTLDQIIYRTIEYKRKGIFVLWLPVFSDKLCSKRYSPRLWERWLHTAYFGRVYYWHSNLNMVPVHFDDHLIHVEESSWFESGGVENYGGGYDKFSKRYKTPKLGKPVNLIKDFKILNRSSTLTNIYTVPESKLFIDTQSKWW